MSTLNQSAEQPSGEAYKKIQELSSSKFNYFFGYVVNFAIVFALLAVVLFQNSLYPDLAPLTAAQWIYIPIAGYLFWTLSEYCLHKFPYHDWKSDISLGHQIHHDHPKNLMGIPWYINSTIFAAFYPLCVLLLDLHAGKTALSMACIWLGYIGYCALHHGTHHWDYKWKWFQAVRKHHLIHHVHPETNMGISCTLWDYIFGTKKR